MPTPPADNDNLTAEEERHLQAVANLRQANTRLQDELDAEKAKTQRLQGELTSTETALTAARAAEAHHKERRMDFIRRLGSALGVFFVCIGLLATVGLIAFAGGKIRDIQLALANPTPTEERLTAVPRTAAVTVADIKTIVDDSATKTGAKIDGVRTDFENRFATFKTDTDANIRAANGELVAQLKAVQDAHATAQDTNVEALEALKAAQSSSTTALAAVKTELADRLKAVELETGKTRVIVSGLTDKLASVERSRLGDAAPAVATAAPAAAAPATTTTTTTTAPAPVATAPAAAAVSTEWRTLANWDGLSRSIRLSLFPEDCKTSKVNKLDADQLNMFQLGVEKSMASEAIAQVPACNVAWFIQKGQPYYTADSDDGDTPKPLSRAINARAEVPTATTAGWVPTEPAGGVRAAPAVVRDGDTVDPTDASYYGRPGLGRPGFPGRPAASGGPRCPRGMHWSREIGKCRDQFHDIPLTPYQQQVLANCPTEIETRWVPQGDRMVERQRCKPGYVSPSRTY